MKRSAWTAWLALALMISGGGCESDEVSRIRTETGAGGPGLEVEFCARVGSKTGRRLDVGRTFTMAEKSHVHAFADFEGLRTDRDYAVHLVWIRPDGRELFRKFAEIRLTGDDGGYHGAIVWKDAEDLHRIKHEEQASPDAAISLDSRLNISTARDRDPGTYIFRVYLDRRLAREATFEILPGAS